MAKKVNLNLSSENPFSVTGVIAFYLSFPGPWPLIIFRLLRKRWTVAEIGHSNVVATTWAEHVAQNQVLIYKSGRKWTASGWSITIASMSSSRPKNNAKNAISCSLKVIIMITTIVILLSNFIHQFKAIIEFKIFFKFSDLLDSFAYKILDFKCWNDFC